MKTLVTLLAVVAVVGFVHVAATLAAEEDARPARPISGELTKIDGKTLTISVRRRDADPTEQTVTVDDKTAYTTQAEVKLADVKVGDRVRITQGEKRFFGEVTKIDGKTLTLSSRRRGGEATEETVTVDDSTKINGSVKAKLEDLKVGMNVAATVTDGKTVRVDVRPAMGGRGREKAKAGEKQEK
ncbi:MAG: hypothetical protein IMZ66_04285 [Planctomycetes bacterium]|nr:hypothetical protein [Planctomycetota bacterium]